MSGFSDHRRGSSGAFPAAGRGATATQPAMYFRLGGGTLKGISKPGEIVWSRNLRREGRLKMDLGRGEVVELPAAGDAASLEATTPQWPIMHAVTYGVSRDQMMARHKANHIQVAYANSAKEADTAMLAKAATARPWEWKCRCAAREKAAKAGDAGIPWQHGENLKL